MSEFAAGTLRLVGIDPPDAHAVEEEIVRENRRAALTVRSGQLRADDPRVILAAQTRAALIGAQLTPDRRARLRLVARHLGIRPFDASLVMAIVQDQARRAETDHSALLDRLAMIPDPSSQPKPPAVRSTLSRLALSGALAAVMLIASLRWLLG